MNVVDSSQVSLSSSSSNNKNDDNVKHNKPQQLSNGLSIHLKECEEKSCFCSFRNSIDRMHKWRPKKIYSFVFVLIRPSSLVPKELFFRILSVLTRLISTKTKEYFFGHHLCIWSMP